MIKINSEQKKCPAKEQEDSKLSYDGNCIQKNFCPQESHPSNNADFKDRRREDILLASLKIFCHKGFEAAKIDDIATEAKCSHGLVYHYFKNKEEVFNELINFSHEKAKTNLDRPFVFSGNSMEKLKHHTEKIFYLIENNEIFIYFFYFITAITFIKKDFDINTVINKPHKENSPYFLLKKIFEEGIEQGFFRKGDAEDFTIIYLSIIHGFIMRKLFKKTDDKLFEKSVSADIVISIFAK